MRLDGIISQAASGLDSINRRLATISQNVANANTPGYVRETVPVESVTAGGEGVGVHTGVATRAIDTALQTELFSSGADVADGQARQTALSAIDGASGVPGSRQDLASLVGGLRDAFSALATDPSNQTQQRLVVQQAAGLASGVNTLGNAISTQRQALQDSLQTDVADANTALASVGQFSTLIIAARSAGQSTAQLEDQRDTAAARVTELTGAKFVTQSNGDLLAVSGGTVLSTHNATGPLAIGTATLGPGSTGPALTVGGAPVSLGTTDAIGAIRGGGKIGAELDLRDRVLPGLQTSLDGFSQALATGFSTVGLLLFTDGSGTSIPAAGTPGFAQTLQVSAAVTATPSIVRDGSLTPGRLGSTVLINAVLGTVLTTGLGSVASQAADLVANNASLAQGATATLTAHQALQTGLQTKLTVQSGVSVDSEMSAMIALQNSYGANAKVISAVQSMWDKLLGAVQ